MIINSYNKNAAIKVFTLENRHGLSAQITNFGAILLSLWVPDRRGHMADVVLGLKDLDEYQRHNPTYFGAIVGRFANRIARGRVTIGNGKYFLNTNHGPHHLHGGENGFDRVIWQATPLDVGGEDSLQLFYLSKDKEEGYPGNLSINVTYTLTAYNELKIEYTATTDQDTILNPTHHSYFNLAGEGKGDIRNHVITINADRFTRCDEDLIPTGEIGSVSHTPLDLRKPIRIGEALSQPHELLRYTHGFDHNYVLNKPGKGDELTLGAKVHDPDSGRAMEVYTTQPGLQFYTGNFLDVPSYCGKLGANYQKYAGFCLEAQYFPDSPNHKAFPSTRLIRGDIYKQLTIYKFQQI